MDAVVIDRIGKRFGEVIALAEVSLTAHAGEFVTLLGPSGCGKTTTLRSIAGLERPDSGRILIEGREVFSHQTGRFVPPERRDLGMVFQSYAIWPHMSVYQNVAYGLNAKRVPRREIKSRVDHALDVVGLAGYGSRPATKLSGGQQQRVALARSLVGEPRVLLLDEPLSNLDAKLRERMRVELKQLQRRMGLTAIYVTHDQSEALALSDRIIVMNGGQIVQQGDSRNIYRDPHDRFVVDFVGQVNFVEGIVRDFDVQSGLALIASDSGLLIRGRVPERAAASIGIGGRATAAVRPEDFHIARGAAGIENAWQANVVADLFLGNMRELLVEANGHTLKVQVASEQPVPANEAILVTADPSTVRILS